MYKKNDIIRIKTGETCMVTNIPGTFLSNGAYEAVVVQIRIDGKYLPLLKDGKKIIKWVKPEDIAYSLTQSDKTESLDHYMEIIYDGQEINLIPKNFTEIKIETNEDGFRILKINYENHLHSTINLLIGKENENID